MAQPAFSPPLYAGAQRIGDLLFVSGQLPIGQGGLLHSGLVGEEVSSVEQAREAARVAAGRCLDLIRNELGSLDAVKGVARIGGYVASGQGFVDASVVIDAASRTILDALGERGHHARLALGVASLPLGACAEVEMTVQC
jgi:enamine deaminase RidA (YjgF/YER057c/UK114 family)